MVYKVVSYLSLSLIMKTEQVSPPHFPSKKAGLNRLSKITELGQY